jgi:hypothetical protein
MGISTDTSCLTPAEEAFLKALLWEEGHLQQGPATRAASEHGLSLLRCLEVANRLSPNLHGEALAGIQEGACPAVEWPWADLRGPEVLQRLWSRLNDEVEKQTKNSQDEDERSAIRQRKYLGAKSSLVLQQSPKENDGDDGHGGIGRPQR